MSQRHERVADVVRAEIAAIMRQEMKDPRVALATVSRVELTRDLGHAKVYVSVLGDDEAARRAALDGLERAQGFVRSTLAKRVRLRTVPQLHFTLDRGAEHSQHISDLLEQLDPEGSAGSEDGDDS
ncbi:MAG: 30S ribosome-binding factor RbfA [Acidobacteriota bacterium]